ncbi:MAG: SDR family oxidoreductase [Actinobacteria bacterium]|nr:SDR family oxidoreductase [Actinomycetota bacterium]
MTAPPERPRRALVTGVSRGIGRGIAARLLGDGWEVLGTYRAGADAAREFAAAEPRLTVHQVDLADDGSVGELIEAAGAAPLDGLVNNAGMIHFEAAGELELEPWRRTLAVNLTAPVRLARALGGQMAAGGAIVNVASVDGTVGSYNSMAYAASKAALLNATKGLANLLGERGVRVNVVTPGWIDTEMANEEELAISLTPLARLGRPAEVADAVAWLLGPQSSFVSGASIVIDGGLSNVDPVLKREWEAG